MAITTAVSVDLAGPRTAYFHALEQGDRRRATEVAFDLLYQGVPATDVLTHLVGSSQVEVGVAWQHGRWSTAQEHRASAVAEAVIHAVAQHALPMARAAEGSAGRVVVACTEGEWHVLPGRLVSEVLRLRGFEVDLVGPSVPAAELARFVALDSPDVVALSCSMPSSLVGAWHAITELRAVGMTILCGGRGFGPDGRWGLALGADQWAVDPADGADLLCAGPPGRPRSRRADAVPREVAAEVNLATREVAGMVEAATHLGMLRWPQQAQQRSAVEKARAMLDMTLRAVLAASLVSDEHLVAEHVAWSESVLAARGRPVGLVAEAFDLLAVSMAGDMPRCLAMARTGLQLCSQPPPTELPREWT